MGFCRFGPAPAPPTPSTGPSPTPRVPRPLTPTRKSRGWEAGKKGLCDPENCGTRPDPTAARKPLGRCPMVRGEAEAGVEEEEVVVVVVVIVVLLATVVAGSATGEVAGDPAPGAERAPLPGKPSA